MRNYLIFFLLLLMSCSSVKAKPNAAGNIENEEMGAGISPAYASLPPAEGSLWSEENESFFNDKKARKVGDIIIVDIIEKSASSLNANTTAKKTSSYSAGIPTLFGVVDNIEEGHYDYQGKKTTNLVGGNQNSDFKGSGSIKRDGQITASIGAVIKEVFPNGDMQIYGKRELKVNNETQYITIAGTVRKSDITQNNRILSTFVANAKIEYSGDGVIANKQKQGWLSSILEKIWPF